MRTLKRALNTTSPTLRLTQLGVILLVGLAIRLAFIQDPGNRDDLNLFFVWLKVALTQPPSEFYAYSHMNYPPGALIIFEAIAQVLRLFVSGEPTVLQMRIAVKLPSIIMDLGGAALAYGLARRYGSHVSGLAAAAFLSFNPAIIYDSAYWGQLDSVPSALALFAVWLLVTGRATFGWVALAFAGLIKPPVFVLIPLFLLYPALVSSKPERKRRVIAAGVGIAASLVMLEAFAVGFFPHPTLLAANRHLFGLLRYSGSAHFPFNSLNAFNVWALFQDFFVLDTTRLLFIPLRIWGYGLFVGAAFLIFRRYWQLREPSALIEACALVLLAFFLFLTQMHERYLCYAIFFIAPLLFMPRWRIPAIILSVTFLLNLEYGISFMYLDDAQVSAVNRHEFSPWLAHLCSAANLSVFAWLLRGYLTRGAAATKPTPGAVQPLTSAAVLTR